MQKDTSPGREIQSIWFCLSETFFQSFIINEMRAIFASHCAKTRKKQPRTINKIGFALVKFYRFSIVSIKEYTVYIFKSNLHETGIK